jgi:hypothetical protein
MFGVAYGPALVLVIVLWMAMTHVVAKTVEKQTPTERAAGA